MKKLFLTCIILFAWCVQAESQKYLNFFQDDIVILKILASDVDSINITETEPYTINLWYEGTVFQSYASEEVDSIIVTDERGEPLSYLGVVGFNSELYTKQVGLLSQSTVSQYESFINNLPKKDGTILYYAVDSALNVTEGANIKTQLSSAYFITFTDGLDQGSIMLNPKYSSSNSYLNDISKHIEEAQVSGLLVNAYAIGLRGKDVTDVNMFKRNLNSLASSEDKAFEVRDISELRSRLQEIANKIISINTRQTISVKIPGIDNGTTIRFTFDGNDASNSQLYIEGTLNLSDYSLHDVTYQGIKARSGSIVQGTQDGVFLTFTFTGMRREDETGTLNTNYVKHFYRLPSSTIWQVNSEFTPTNNIQRNVSYSGTSIMLVLDCSSSLGSDFSKMQSYAKEFINMVAKNAMPYSFGTPRNVLAVMDSTNLTIDISWDAVTYADYYMVYRNNSNSSYSNYTLIADSVASTSWKDERPMSGNNYYKVCAVGLGLTSEKSNGSSSVSCSLDAPKNISGELVQNGDSLAIRMKWDAVKYAEHYKIYRSNNYSNGYELMEDSVTNISWMDASPLAGSNYYKICAVSRSITSSESNYCEVKCALDVPKNVKATLGDVDLVVNVTWDKVNVAQWYMVYRSNSSNSGYKLLVDSVASTTWRDDAPMKGNNYYKVSAAGYGLTSSQSNASNVVNCSLDAPKNIKATFDDSTFSISVTWDEVKYAKHYKIYRSNSSNSDYGLLADSVASTSWKDFAPMKGKNYYKVYAVCNEIISAASNYATANCPLELDAPKNLVGEMILNDGKLVINVKWDSTKNAEYYKVYRSSNNNSGFTLIADAIMYSSFIDESPLSGINYYRVRAFGHGLSSPDSNTSEGISFSLPAPEHVTGNLIQDGDSPIINIAWDSVKYAKSYNVYRCNLSYGEFVLLAEGISSTFWRDEVPLKGRNYYKVSASGYGLTSPLSAAVKIANYANMGQIAINTIISDGDMQPIFVGGYINNYNEDYVTKKGVIVSKQIGDLIINENSKFEKIGEDRTPKDLRVIDCTGINEEEFMCGLLDLEGNTDYYVRAFAITDEGEVLYGDEEIVHSQTFSRYKGRADYANVYYYNSYTLFDLVTDEIISPEQGYYGSTNENPKRVAYKPSYACYKFATEWNYKLWYYHSGHCDNNKKVSIPVMRMNDGKLEITKAEADKDKTVSIFYCVDGDGRHPENFSEKYTSPINVAKGSAVYCYAISSDGYISYTNRYIVF